MYIGKGMRGIGIKLLDNGPLHFKKPVFSYNNETVFVQPFFF